MTKVTNIRQESLISVIIPVYNVEAYLSRCLDSVYQNTYTNLEIICVNDGSTDNSLKILNEQNDSRLIVIDKKHTGLLDTRRVGVQAATGEYIAFVDSDDWIHPQYFECLYNVLGKDCDMSVCGFTRTDEYKIKEGIKNNEPQFMNVAEAMKNRHIRGHVWGRLFRANLLEEVVFPKEVVMLEDRVVCMQALVKCRKVSYISDELYYYFNRPHSLVHEYATDILPAGVAFEELAKKYESKVFLREAYAAFLAHRYLNMFKQDYSSIERKLKRHFKCCKKMSKKLMPLRQRMILNIMVNFPWLYRLYRIIGDRTMLDWEQQQRRKLCKKSLTS